jgi:nucleotide-binding universal stress UspA family protein
MNVLLGIGGSQDSFRALERMAERTAGTGDDLTVAVLENPRSDVAPEEIERRARAAIEDAGLPLADVRGEGVVVRYLTGDPGPRLVEVADREGFDRIVLGGGQRSPMGKIAVGEIAEFVLVNARTTVTLVR